MTFNPSARKVDLIHDGGTSVGWLKTGPVGVRGTALAPVASPPP